MSKILDAEYQEHTITNVEEDGSYYSIQIDDGFHFGFEKTSVVPKIGDIARFYGKGLGYIIRGLDINGQEIFYKTAEEQQIANKKAAEEENDKRYTEYLVNKEDYQKQYSNFPEIFQERINNFRERNSNFWEFEGYEIFCCDEALKIVKLGSPEAITKFHQAKIKEQKQIVPDCDYDNHSGNTFGTACYFARIYLENPVLIPKMHGALCPMVGCEKYGCYSTTINRLENQDGKATRTATL